MNAKDVGQKASLAGRRVGDGKESRSFLNEDGTIDITPVGGKTINPRLVLVALMFVIASFQLCATMLSPAIGDMAESFNTNAGVIGWSTTIFLAVAAALAIFFPPFADKIGRRNTLLISVGLMLLGTVIVLVTSSLVGLFIGRALQGFCGATFALGNLTLRAILDPKKFGFYVGLVAAINSGVAGIDTLLGGLLADAWGYKSIFVVILALEILALITVIRWVPETKVKSAQNMDWAGAVFLTGALWAFNMVLTFGFGTLGWSSPWTIGFAIVGVVCSVVFTMVEKRASHALIPLSELGQRETWAQVGTTFFTLASSFAVLMFLIPAFAQDSNAGFGLGSTVTALMYLMPFSLLGWMLAPVVGKVAPNVGYRLVLRAGLVGSLVVIVCILLFGFSNKWILCGLSFLMGATYTAMSNTTLNALGVLYASSRHPGVLPGLTSAAFNLGSGVGIGVMGSVIAAAAVSGDISSGYRQSLIIAIVLSGVALALSLFMPGRTSEHERI